MIGRLLARLLLGRLLVEAPELFTPELAAASVSGALAELENEKAPREGRGAIPSAPGYRVPCCLSDCCASLTGRAAGGNTYAE